MKIPTFPLLLLFLLCLQQLSSQESPTKPSQRPPKDRREAKETKERASKMPEFPRMPEVKLKQPVRKPKKEIKAGDYEEKMQALTCCYFIFDKVIEDHDREFHEFMGNYTLNQTEFYKRVRLDHIEKCLVHIADWNLTKLLNTVADESVKGEYYERTGLMRFSLAKYEDGNFSTNYSRGNELLQAFIEEIDSTVSDDYMKKNFGRFGGRIEVFESEKANRVLLFVALAVILCGFGLIIYYLTRGKEDSKRKRKDKKKKN